MAWGKGSWSLRKIFGGGAKVAPEETPEATPEESPEVTPEATPKVTRKAIPKLTRKATPKVTARATKSAATEDARIDENTWQTLEDALIGADFGLELAEELVATVRSEVERIGTTKADDAIDILRDAVEEKLARYDPTLRLTERPAVVLVVGVNGVGKTTTIGKFAKFLANAGRSVVIAAADTFRAAAVEQLTTWAERAGVAIVTPEREGQDPASVAYQAVERAIAEGIEIVVVDTAGRLHTKAGLMDELGKIRRVIEKVAPVSEVLLVLDATTGQNGVVQAEAFLEHAGVTGLVLTKLDGSAKAGFVMRVQELTGLPIKLLGQGESVGDMTGFSPAQFAKALTS
jgi:fused signal recognition particle receptor